MKNRRRLTGKELLVLCGLFGAAFGTMSATWDDWETIRIILIFGLIFLFAVLVFAYFYGVKIDEEKH